MRSSTGRPIGAGPARRVASRHAHARARSRAGPRCRSSASGRTTSGCGSTTTQTVAVIDAALEHGITLFDTADIYGQGMSEDFIGRALEGRRDRVVLATKFGKPMDERPDDSRGSRDYIRWAVEGSLRRLRTDVIDVYQMHEPDPSTPIEETLDALHELVQEGIVRHIGSCELLGGADRGSRPRRARARPHALRRGAEPLLARRARGRGRDPARVRAARHRHAPVLPARERAPHGQVHARRRGDRGPARRPRGARGALGPARARCRRYADERGVPLLSVAIGGLAAMPAVASVIAGATKPEQVAANVARRRVGAERGRPRGAGAAALDARNEPPQPLPLRRQIEAEQRERERVREHEQERRRERQMPPRAPRPSARRRRRRP